MATVIIHSDFRAPQNKICQGILFSPFCLPWSVGTRWKDHDFFKAAFQASSFTLMKRHFCFSSLSAIRVVSTVYLMLLIFLLAILITVCDSSSLAFRIMYSAYKLNYQGDNIQPWCTPFPIWNQSVVPCLFLTVASWPEYRFLKRQVGWSGIPISWRIFHGLLWSTQSKGLA